MLRLSNHGHACMLLYVHVVIKLITYYFLKNIYKYLNVKNGSKRITNPWFRYDIACKQLYNKQFTIGFGLDIGPYNPNTVYG